MLPLIQFPGPDGAGPRSYVSSVPAGDFTPLPATDYKPSVYYYRRAIRSARTKAQAQAEGLAVCTELENLKAWVRDQGMQPPKWLVTPDEARAKGWA